jgi:serine/threonine-protein kinase HipA
MDGFFGAIRDAMPDSWGRRVIERHLRTDQLPEFDCLMHGPDDRAGALGFGLNQQPPQSENRFNRTLDLERLQRAAEAIIADDPDLDGSAAQRAEDLLLLGGPSMGGERPKAVVEEGDSLWIAKFTRQDDRWNHPRIEHALLELARTCGLNAVDSKLTTVAGRDVLLVRRFDRDRSEGGYHRHRMVSALTLLRADDDAMARRNWSYLMLADEIRRASASPEADLRELYGRICFNGAVSNLDDHPRNHAMLAIDNNWRLSPAYDLTPSPAISQDARDLAMACGTHGRLASKANIMSGCGRFLLSEDDARGIFETIAETVRREWLAAMRHAGVSERDCERIARAFLYEGLFYVGAATPAGKWR